MTFESYAGPGVYDALVEVRLMPADGDVVEFSGTTTAVFDENAHGAMGVNLRGAAGEFSASIQWDCGATRTPR